jgi:hypothetical protein
MLPARVAWSADITSSHPYTLAYPKSVLLH